MLIKKSQIPVLIFTLIYLIVSLFIFIKRANHEFVLYVGVIIFLFLVILFTNKKVSYPNFVLWLLSIWGLFHMLGGGLLFKEGSMRLYEVILIPLSNTYPIFRYDQFVHIFGFFAATILMWVLIKPVLKKDFENWAAISIVIVMAGLGVGAFNELVEFLAVVLFPETGVGGFLNVSLDLVADLIGSILAMIYIYLRRGKI